MSFKPVITAPFAPAAVLALARTPQGEAALRATAKALKARGPLDAEQQRVLAQVELATWRPDSGLQVQGAADQLSAFRTMVRRAMLQSPAFARVVRDIEADPAHPVKVTLVRGAPGPLDAFGARTLDLQDLDALPASPGPAFPEQTTQGAMLTHLLQERRLAALGYDRDTSHAFAIRAENAFRRDLGQKTMRIDAPGKDESLAERAVIRHFDDGHSEVMTLDPRGRLLGTHWARTAPLPPPEIPFLLF